MTIGETLQLFRLNYKKSQQEFCQTIVSISYYAKVEKDKSNISAELLFQLLEANNISIKEFYLIKNEHLELTENHLFNQIKKYYYTSNKQGLSEVLEDLEDIPNKKVRYDYTVLTQSLMELLDGKPFDKEKEDYFKDYLFQINTWGRYEYRLFSLCAILFDLDTLHRLTHQIMSKMAYRSQYTGFEEDISRTFIHLTVPFIQEGRVEEARHYLSMAETVLEGTTLVYEKLLVELLKAKLIKNSQFDRENESQKQIKLILSVFQLMDLEFVPLNILKKLEKK